MKGLPQHESKLWSVRTCFSCLDLACAASSKSKTRLRVEVVNDQVSLYVETPTTRVSSAGKNTLGAAYDPNSGRSYVAAYQNQMHVLPSISNQVPFTLGSGQQVEINSNGVGPITTVGQTSGGSAYVSPMERISTAQLGKQGGCHTDPTTGEIVCVERISDFSNSMSRESERSSIVQSGTSAIPYCLQECETYTSEICGTWTLQGSHINALWNNGSKATLNVVQFDNKAVVILAKVLKDIYWVDSSI